jgi:hypothetical protein
MWALQQVYPIDDDAVSRDHLIVSSITTLLTQLKTVAGANNLAASSLFGGPLGGTQTAAVFAMLAYLSIFLPLSSARIGPPAFGQVRAGAVTVPGVRVYRIPG